MDGVIKECLDAFEECEEASRENHEAWKEDVEFARLSKQWPDAVKQQRSAEGRPCLTINKLAPVIRQVVNDSRRNKPSIKVHPVDDSADPETAEVIAGLIRNIEVTSDADVAYDTAVDNAVTGGFGYWKVNIEHTRDDTFDQDICIRRVINPLTIFGDPRSTAADSSDWNVAFEVETIRKQEYKRRFKGASEADFNSRVWKDLKAPWIDNDDIQIASWWQREEIQRTIIGLTDGSVVAETDYLERRDEFMMHGIEPTGVSRKVPSWKVTQRIMSGAEELEKVEWVGKYIPIIPVYGDEVFLDGRRYFRSLIRDAKDPARMFNYWRTAGTEIVALAPRVPFIGRKGAFETDAAKWATINNASHPFVEYDGPERPERQPFMGQAAGMLQEALNAADDIKAVTGIYDASLGARSNETSGKAIQVRQMEGDISTFHFIDNVSRAIRHTGRVIIDLIPKVYNTERVGRVLGEDMTPENKPLNQPYEIKPAKQREDGEVEPSVMAMHDLRVGKYDVTVSSGPNFTTMRQEAAQQMMELIRSFPDAAPIIGDLVAKNLDWPGADDIAERLKKMLPPNLQEDDDKGDDPRLAMAQQQMMQMQQALEAAKAEIAKLSEKQQADAAKVQIEAYKAETERLNVVQQQMDPVAIQQIVLKTISDLLTPGGAEGDMSGQATAA